MLAGGYSPAIGSVSPVATLVETGDIFTATHRGGGGGGGKSATIVREGSARGPTPYPPEPFLDFLTPIKCTC